MMRRNLLQIFWGVAFVAVDVRVWDFDVLPDVIGYIVIYHALAQLETADLAFRLAKPFAIAGALYTAVLLFASPNWLTALIVFAVDTLLGWCLLTAIARLSLARDLSAFEFLAHDPRMRAAAITDPGPRLPPPTTDQPATNNDPSPSSIAFADVTLYWRRWYVGVAILAAAADLIFGLRLAVLPWIPLLIFQLWMALLLLPPLWRAATELETVDVAA
jgi:hypothetical protein